MLQMYYYMCWDNYLIRQNYTDLIDINYMGEEMYVIKDYYVDIIS